MIEKQTLIRSANETSSIRELAPSISGYQYERAAVAANGTDAVTETRNIVQRIQYNSWSERWEYSRSDHGYNWGSISGNNRVYLIYSEVEPPTGKIEAKVYLRYSNAVP